MRALTQLALRAVSLTVTVALLLPGSAMAVDPLPARSADGAAATLLVVLLLGSVTAGLFFASPLRRRLVRAPYASSSPPPEREAPRELRLPGADGVNRLADRVHARLSAMTSRWPRLRTATPLPPMPGGDIFLDEDPLPASAWSLPRAAPVQPSASGPSPWSTNPISPDRYDPFR